MPQSRQRVVARRPTQRHQADRERLKITEWVQAIAAVMAVLLAGWAGGVALETLKDQQQINRSQLVLNQLVQDRALQRYAARVAFWGDTSSGGTVYIQNRSPVPLIDVTFKLLLGSYVGEGPDGDLARDGFRIGDVPPCAIVTARLLRLDTNIVIEMDVSAQFWELSFTDPNGDWTRTSDGLSRIQNHAGEENGDVSRTSVAVEDCGEAG